jgi:hypothetical protein
MPDNVEEIKQLIARYWQKFASLVVGTLTIIKIYYDYSAKSTLTRLVITAGVGICIILLIRFPKIAIRLTRMILGRPPIPPDLKVFRGPRPYFEGDKLPGRNAATEECWQLLLQKPFLIIQGESGCGKSSFLNANLVPRLKTKFTVLECRVADDPIGRLACTCMRQPYRPSPENTDISHLPETIRKASSSSQDSSSPGDILKPVLIVMDQFEELFVTVNSETRLQFMSALRDAVHHSEIRLLIAIREDFSDLLLELCRATDPSQVTFNLGNYFSLHSFTKAEADGVLKEMLEPFHKGDPIARQSITGLASSLVNELLLPPRDKRRYQDDEKTVLPVELSITGMMIEHLGIEKVMSKGLGRFGGKVGLLRIYIDQSKEYVWRRTGVKGDRSLLILRQLVSPARTKWPQTPSGIAIGLNVPEKAVTAVLKAFADQFIVNTLPHNDQEGAPGTTVVQYELMHEHLVKVLMEAPQPILQKARDAEERLVFWQKRTDPLFLSPAGDASVTSPWRHFYAQPIPLSETMSLWRFATGIDQRRMLRRNLKGFFRRLASLPIIALLAIGVYWLWYTSDAHQIELVLKNAPADAITNLSSNENFEDAYEWPNVLIQSGRGEEAMAILAGINSSFVRSEGFASAATEFTRLGLIPSAEKALIQSMELSDDQYFYKKQATAINLLTDSLARKNEEAAIPPILDHLANTSARATAYAYYAITLSQLDRPAEAGNARGKIFAVVDAWPDSSVKAIKYLQLCNFMNNHIEFIAPRSMLNKALTWLPRRDTSFKLLVNLMKFCWQYGEQDTAMHIWSRISKLKFEEIYDDGFGSTGSLMQDAAKRPDIHRMITILLANTPPGHINDDVFNEIAIGLLLGGDHPDADLMINYLKRYTTKAAVYKTLASLAKNMGKDPSQFDELLRRSPGISSTFPAMPPDSVKGRSYKYPFFYQDATDEAIRIINSGNYTQGLTMALNYDFEPGESDRCCKPPSIPGEYSTYSDAYLSPLACALLAVLNKGETDSVNNYVPGLKSLFDKNLVLSYLMVRQEEGGELQKAAATQALILSNLTRLEKEPPRPKNSLSSASSIYFPVYNMASALLKKGQSDSAIFLMEHYIQDPDYKDARLSELVKSLSTDHKYEVALRAAALIRSVYTKETSLSDILLYSADSMDLNIILPMLPAAAHSGRLFNTTIQTIIGRVYNKFSLRRAKVVADSFSSPSYKLFAYTEILRQYIRKHSH